MKIKRFVAKDMRTALAEVKQLLGPDAVILSNKKTAEGVEIVAAVDPQATPAPVAAKAAPKAAVAERRPVDDELPSDRVSLASGKMPALGGVNAQAKASAIAASLQELLSRQVQQPEPAATTPRPIVAGAKPLPRPDESNVRSVKFPKIAPRGSEQPPQPRNFGRPAGGDELGQMRQELSQLRGMLQHQLSGLLWQDMERRDPLRAMLIDRLQRFGFDNHLAEQIACYVPEEWQHESAWPQVLNLLAEQVRTGRDEILRQGGVVALIGPTGVGKTTTIAKLAARFARTHGPDSVALISTDTYRIGAHEQLATYGRIIGCQVKVAHDANELTEHLQRFRNRKLVLIDTAGMSQRDERLHAHLESLLRDTNANIRSYLVLPANGQRRVMQETVEHFRCVTLSGLIVSKVDECLSLGEILGVAIQNALSISYLTDGQRVPEDLAVADGLQLVEMANALLEQSPEPAYPWMTDPQSGSSAARYEQYSR